MMPTPDVSVILVNWNTRELADNAISSLLKHETSVALEIILIDNDSSDGSADYLESRHPGVRVIRNKVNEGFARANNTGVALASGEFVLLLNTDTLFTEQVLPACLAIARAHAPAIVGCRLRNADGSLQVSAAEFPTLLGYMGEVFDESSDARLRNERKLKQVSSTARVDWLCGAFILVERAVYNRIGGLSAEIFMYGEDVEFCWRAGRAGIHCHYVPEVSIVHFGGGGVDHSSLRALLLVDAGRVRAFSLMRGSVAALMLRLIFLCRSAVRVILFCAGGILRRDPMLIRRARNHGKAILELAGWANARNLV